MQWIVTLFALPGLYFSLEVLKKENQIIKITISKAEMCEPNKAQHT